MSFDVLINRLDLQSYPEVLKQYYGDTLLEFEQSGVFFLKKDYINSVHQTCDCFVKSLSYLLEAAEAIENNSDLALYALLVYKTLLNREVTMAHLPEFVFPQQQGIAYDFLPFMVLIPFIVDLYEKLKNKQIEEDVIKATVSQYEACLYIYSERYDRLGLNKHYFDWLQGYVDGRFLNIGRLRFEMIALEDPIRVYKDKNNDIKILLEKGEFNQQGMLSDTPPICAEEVYQNADFIETDTFVEGYSIENGKVSTRVILEHSNWNCVLKQGDKVLSVHIPPNESFTQELCRQSYERAEQIFAEKIPEFPFKAFHCHSWLLESALADILKPGSNIVAFQKAFMCYPVHTNGEDVFNFVFKLKFNNFQDMQEDTSLQRAIKKKYIAGEYIYEYGGVFLRK